MQRPFVDIALLGLLVTFFGIQQRSRPQLYFRYWFAGWILVFSSFMAYESLFFIPVPVVLQHAAKMESLYIGGMAFLLSFLVKPGNERRGIFGALLVAIPACSLIQTADAGKSLLWADYSLIVVMQLALLRLILRLVPKDWAWRRWILVASIPMFGATMLCTTWHQPQHDLEQWILAQLFMSVGILYAGTGVEHSLDRYAGTIGFLVWGGVYPFVVWLQHDREALSLLYQLWNIPKYCVGCAMMLRIFEGARSDIERLADRYKDLYEDFRLVYENHPLPMWIYEAATSLFLSANGAATSSYGYTQSEFLEMSVEAIRVAGPGRGSGYVNPDALRSDSKERAKAGRVRHRRKDGSTLTVELTEREILFQGRDARFVLAVDVTERERLNQDLFHLAQHDALTGLPNRLLLDDRIDQCLRRCMREHKKAVLFTIDADRFKLINDTFGHGVGDETLKAIADRLRGNLRSVDTIARTGGEEFTAVVGGLNSREDAERIAGLFIRLFEQPLSLPSQEMKVSVSVGGAMYPDDAECAEELRKRSDQALYHAKRMGRNRFAFASREVCASFDEAMSIEIALRNALRNDAFELNFQPVYNNSGSAKHCEALLRMKAGFGPVYGPAQFIPIAEESGLIIPLGNWVVKAACKHLVEFRRLGGDEVSVAVNVSGRQLLQKGFTDYVLDTLREHSLPPSALQIELTESSLMSEPGTIRDMMQVLADRGIRFAIDDFGTGYSSLARLADLPISLLKIDKSFVQQLDRTRRGDGIVTAIIQMAQTLLVQVVAEGVEEESQLNLLLRRGCDLFQGYYLARPWSAADMERALAEESDMLLNHPNFCHTRVAVSKRLRRFGQLPALAVPGNKL